MKLASFDLEIANELIPDQPVENLGISCAALAILPPIQPQDENEPEVIYWYDHPQINKEECQKLVSDLQYYVSKGYTLLTWNGCGFDFKVLAQESGLYEECAELAINHIDLMLIVTFIKGHYLGLDKALRGAGLEGKKHSVILKSGETIENMNGALAPKMWADGEIDAVLEYIKGDVEQPLQLAFWINAEHKMLWQSNSGKINWLYVPKLYTVKELFELPEPDTSWMANPPKRDSFVEWMKVK